MFGFCVRVVRVKDSLHNQKVSRERQVNHLSNINKSTSYTKGETVGVNLNGQLLTFTEIGVL